MDIGTLDYFQLSLSAVAMRHGYSRNTLKIRQMRGNCNVKKVKLAVQMSGHTFSKRSVYIHINLMYELLNTIQNDYPKFNKV